MLFTISQDEMDSECVVSIASVADSPPQVDDVTFDW